MSGLGGSGGGMSSSLDSGDALLMTRIRRLRGFLVKVERASSDMAMGERDGERRETGRAERARAVRSRAMIVVDGRRRRKERGERRTRRGRLQRAEGTEAARRRLPWAGARASSC